MYCVGIFTCPNNGNFENCIGTLSQLTERSAERHVWQETGWLADRCSVSQQLGALQTHSSSFLTQRTYSSSNFVAISSLVLELLKKCRVW